jgi:hypothetical protein
MKHTIILTKTGRIQWLSPPPFPLKIEKRTRQRFSEIVPANQLKRVAFRLLRRVFGEEGRVADWTRSWLCRWHAEILIGKHKGETFEHGLRACCLEFEREKFCEPRFDL